ncbi:methyltransferase [Candidatus Poribacteria bacterium]|nr:methyltransferase [Candidatus Poribacteria bacterium]
MDLDRLKRDQVIRADIRDSEYVFNTTWGIFSPRGIDTGTRLLLERIEVNPGENCLDVGCGYGPIGLVMARLSGTGGVTMVDKDFVAVEYARKNAEANGLTNCEAMLSNGLSHLPPDARFDVIAANLPSNTGKELLDIMTVEARQHLVPGGRLYVVTINGLRDYMKKAFRDTFGHYKKLKQGRGHAVAMTTRRG